MKLTHMFWRLKNAKTGTLGFFGQRCWKIKHPWAVFWYYFGTNHDWVDFKADKYASRGTLWILQGHLGTKSANYHFQPLNLNVKKSNFFLHRELPKCIKHQTYTHIPRINAVLHEYWIYVYVLIRARTWLSRAYTE